MNVQRIFARSQVAVKNFMKRLDVQYPVLIVPVAVSDPQRTEKTLPQLERIPAFPTTIFIDRKGDIQTIHAGFSGPEQARLTTSGKKRNIITLFRNYWQNNSAT